MLVLGYIDVALGPGEEVVIDAVRLLAIPIPNSLRLKRTRVPGSVTRPGMGRRVHLNSNNEKPSMKKSADSLIKYA